MPGVIVIAPAEHAAMPALRTVLLMSTITALAACGGQDEPAPPDSTAVPPELPAPDPQAALGDCADEPGIRYVCGPVNAEDILRLGESQWLLVSGMNGQLSGLEQNGNLYLVNLADKSWRPFFPGGAPLLEHDTARFPDCPGPLDTSDFSAHGLALQALESGPWRYSLYMTSHGAREAVEIFEI